MSRTSRFIVVALLVLVLAAVAGCQRRVEVQSGTRIVCTYGHTISDTVRTIRVPADKASAYRVTTITRTCPLHAKLQRLYESAQDDITAGKLKEAQLKLTQVVAGDAAFGQARQQLDQIAAGKKPKPDRSGAQPSQDSGSDDDSSTGTTATPVAAASLTRWIPGTLAGYTAQKPSVGTVSVARNYVPSDDSIVLVVVAAEQFRTAAQAKDAVTSQGLVQRSHDRSSVKIGAHSVQFGTDGRRFAVMAFSDGPVMVAVEAASRESGSPQQMKDALAAVVRQLP